jgi:CubicO group peptidase (beta-lactamase class C family)
VSSGINDIAPVPAGQGRIDPARIDLAAADAIATAFFERGGAPALSYGIVANGALVHSAGYGSYSAGGAAPDADTVFRIASMSKSFTASSILLLRDAGDLSLDDPASAYVPELESWPANQRHITPDAAPVSIRHLLTMTAGLPTDDPWGDRQQGLPADEFGKLLAAGVSWNWAPGTRFEYSNLGYAILGRVITAASGTEFSSFVRERLLVPLGMTRTGYTAEEFGGVSAPAGGVACPPPSEAANMAQGYRHGAGGWEAVPYEPYGAFAPMGGIYSTVRDLATWATGFTDAFPPGEVFPPEAGLALPGRSHPLAAASRREMQLPQSVSGWRAPVRLPGGGPAGPAYYGFGLFVDEDPEAGRTSGHSGGYPGFGSNMRWHLPTGIAVIALANGTYAGTSTLTGLVLREIIPSSTASHVALAPSARPGAASAGPGAASAGPGASSAGPGAPTGGPWPETLAAKAKADELLQSWDDAAADALFTPNVGWDTPYTERRRSIGLVRERIGAFAPDDSRPPESDTPAHRRWWLTGERGTVQAQIQLSPEREPRVQSLSLTVPPAADSSLARALDAIVTWLNRVSEPGGLSGPAWPEAVPVAGEADAGVMTRHLRMAAVWTGTVRTGVFRGGDGTSSVSVELEGEHASVTLTLAVNGAGELRAADVAL